MKMNFNGWAFREAKWYEFWYPQSGYIGGVIMGAAIGLPVLLWFFFRVL